MKTCFSLFLLLPAFAGATPDPLPALAFPDQASVSRLATRHAACTWTAPGKVRIAFEKAAWPNVFFTAGQAYASQDWSQAGALAIDVANPGDLPLAIHVRVDDSPLANGSVHCRGGNASLAPRERATLLLPLDASAVTGMRAGPPLEAGPHTRRFEGGGTIDCRTIVAFQIHLAKPDRPCQLDLFGIRWLPKPDLNGIVDRFGQFTRADWPGKLHDEADLPRWLAEERQWLGEHPPAADRDEFGGWKHGPQREARGYFRTECIDGRWWLVTPGGHLFWSIGVDCVRPEERSPLRGRESLFTWLPDGATRSGGVDFYQTNLRRKYGESWESEWAKLACARLPAWGFNTIGNWSHPSVFRLRRVPYTVNINLGGLPRIGEKPAPDTHDRRLPDYFDPTFPAKAGEAIAKAVAEWRDDPWCIGYFVDNELGWDNWTQGGAGGGLKVAREVLASPATIPSGVQFRDRLRTKYGSVEAFTKAWNLPPVTSWDAPVDLTGKALPDAARADCSAFLTAIAERYFSVVSAALKQHAPRQLYLGCRFSVRPPDVVNVAEKYCDVVSFNIYDESVSPEKWNFTQELGKPVLIGEFHFGAVDRGLFHPGLRRRESQAARAEAFATYVESVLAMPAFVGCHWFQYADQPLTGRFDGENYNIGFVTITDTPYPEMRQAARDINERIYSLRGSD